MQMSDVTMRVVSREFTLKAVASSIHRIDLRLEEPTGDMSMPALPIFLMCPARRSSSRRSTGYRASFTHIHVGFARAISFLYAAGCHR